MLKMELENLDNLDESVSKLYVKQDNGTFKLDLEPVQDQHEKNEDDKGKIPKARLDQEISKRRLAEDELKTIADDLKKDVPEDFQELVPDLSPGKLISWLRSANVKGLFDTKSTKEIDPKRPGAQQASTELENVNPVELIKMGLNKK